MRKHLAHRTCELCGGVLRTRARPLRASFSDAELRLLIYSLDEHAGRARWKSNELAAKNLANRLFELIHPTTHFPPMRRTT